MPKFSVTIGNNLTGAELRRQLDSLPRPQLSNTPVLPGLPSSAARLAELEAKFPGVKFTGDPMDSVIDASRLKIAPGAHVHMANGLQLLGTTELGPNAVVTGGSLKDAKVDGEVTGGKLEGTTVETGARVSGGKFQVETVKADADTYRPGETPAAVDPGAPGELRTTFDARTTQLIHNFSDGIGRMTIMGDVDYVVMKDGQINIGGVRGGVKVTGDADGVVVVNNGVIKMDF
jgi:hypothetical protein